jgi:hypothetical protein
VSHSSLLEEMGGSEGKNYITMETIYRFKCDNISNLTQNYRQIILFLSVKFESATVIREKEKVK